MAQKIKVTALLSALLLSACSTSLPPPPEPTGKETPVNPSEIKLSELRS